MNWIFSSSVRTSTDMAFLSLRTFQAGKQQPTCLKRHRSFASGIFVCLSLLFVCFSSEASSAEARGETAAEEYGIKSAFLFHFLRYIQLSPEIDKASSDDIFVCAVAPQEFFGMLDTLEGKKVLHRVVKVRYIENTAFDLSSEPCHVLFVPRSNGSKIAPILSSVREQGILTVGETPEFCAQGGVVNFFELAEKIRFEIHLGNAAAENIQLSAQLLKLARVIGAGP